MVSELTRNQVKISFEIIMHTIILYLYAPTFAMFERVASISPGYILISTHSNMFPMETESSNSRPPKANSMLSEKASL